MGKKGKWRQRKEEHKTKGQEEEGNSKVKKKTEQHGYWNFLNTMSSNYNVLG